jgi:hypothetical protein
VEAKHEAQSSNASITNKFLKNNKIQTNEIPDTFSLKTWNEEKV